MANIVNQFRLLGKFSFVIYLRTKGTRSTAASRSTSTLPVGRKTTRMLKKGLLKQTMLLILSITLLLLP